MLGRLAHDYGVTGVPFHLATRHKETGRSFAIPLRVWANSQYGVIAAVTTMLKIDGQPVKSGN